MKLYSQKLVVAKQVSNTSFRKKLGTQETYSAYSSSQNTPKALTFPGKTHLL